MNPQPPRATPRSGPQPLDPRTLGRPVHLLPRFAEQLGEALGELFLGHNRRYRAQYEIGAISIKPMGPEAVAGRWMVGEAEHGRVACLAERSLVLNLMAHRYGNTGADANNNEPPAETATEERMLSWLSLQSLQCALRLIGEHVDAAAPALQLQPSLQPQLKAGSWLIQINVRELGQGLQSQLLLALDPLYIGKLLKRLGQALPQPCRPDTQQLAKQLKLKLEARLLEQTLPLGELLDLRPGDLIPVRLKTTDVLVDGALLFTASVAEHQGKLCLTSFVDAE